MAVSPALTTFLFELVNFLTLAAVLTWLLFTPVRKMLQTRLAADQKRADEIAARTAEAERLHDEWQTKTASLEAEMAELRSARLGEASRQADAILAKARGAADEERARTERLIAQVEQAQVRRLADAAATTARGAVERLLASLALPNLEASLLGAACRELQRLGPESLGAVVVESAVALAEDARATLAAATGTRATATTFQVTPELGVGLRITTSQGLIDVSAAGMAAAAERQLQEALGAADAKAAT